MKKFDYLQNDTFHVNIIGNVEKNNIGGFVSNWSYNILSDFS